MGGTAPHPLLLTALQRANLDPTRAPSLNTTFRTPSGGTYYAKLARTPRALAALHAEAAGLQAMGRTAPPGLVPRVWVEEGAGEAVMVTEFAQSGCGYGRRGGDAQAALGRAVAVMHRPPPCSAGGDDAGEMGPGGEYTGKYGFHMPTHCGATAQDNTWEASWEVFFAERRMGVVVRLLGDARVARAWEAMKRRAIPLLLRTFSPPPTPVILHGDLWSGNVCWTEHGPVIYDPASYYGHGEADLGITHMFGGFSSAFYDAYHEVHPRSAPWYGERMVLYECYHHLNHAVLFGGGGYTSSALRMMNELVAWAKDVDGATE